MENSGLTDPVPHVTKLLTACATNFFSLPLINIYTKQSSCASSKSSTYNEINCTMLKATAYSLQLDNRDRDETQELLPVSESTIHDRSWNYQPLVKLILTLPFPLLVHELRVTHFVCCSFLLSHSSICTLVCRNGWSKSSNRVCAVVNTWKNKKQDVASPSKVRLHITPASWLLQYPAHRRGRQRGDVVAAFAASVAEAGSIEAEVNQINSFSWLGQSH